jgi:hypothetical protein
MSQNYVVVPLRKGKDPAAYRPQPARSDRDYWPTIDIGLIALAVHEMLPLVPAGVTIWEIAAGGGRLVDPVREAGREVHATDLYPSPDRSDIAVHDFLYGAPPNEAAGSVAMTNPPHSKLTQFLTRGLTLIDTDTLRAWRC